MSFAACESTQSHCKQHQSFGGTEEVNATNAHQNKTSTPDQLEFQEEVGTVSVIDGIVRNYEAAKVGVEIQNHGLSGLIVNSAHGNKTWLDTSNSSGNVGLSRITDDLIKPALVGHDNKSLQEDGPTPIKVGTSEFLGIIKGQLTSKFSVTDDIPTIKIVLNKTELENKNQSSGIGVDKLSQNIIKGIKEYPKEDISLNQTQPGVAGITDDLIYTVKINETQSSKKPFIGVAKVSDSTIKHIQDGVIVSHRGSAVVAGIKDDLFKFAKQNHNKTIDHQSKVSNIAIGDNLAEAEIQSLNTSSALDQGVARVAHILIQNITGLHKNDTFVHQDVDIVTVGVSRIQGDLIQISTNHLNTSAATNHTEGNLQVEFGKPSENIIKSNKDVTQNNPILQRNPKVGLARIEDALAAIANQHNKTVPSPEHEDPSKVSRIMDDLVQESDKLPEAEKINYGIIYKMLSAIKGYHIVKPPKLMEIEQDGDKIRVRVNRIKGARTVFAEKDIPEELIS